MQIVDTHCHIYLPEFDADRDEVVKRSVSAGVRTILMPNIDSSSVAPMLAVEESFPGICLPMMALHPTSVKENYRQELEGVEARLAEHKYYGIGETGIDLYWDKTFINEQLISFRRHLELAEDHQLPVVIHARKSLECYHLRIKGIRLRSCHRCFSCLPRKCKEARQVWDGIPDRYRRCDHLPEQPSWRSRNRGRYK